jgi:hypothetical protein
MLVVLALLASIGGHWALLQSVAWTRMLVERTRGESFARAVTTTFDGEHPCALCKRIATGKQSGKRPDKAPIAVKMDLLFERRPLAILPPSTRAELPDRASHALSRVESPPVPPPRVA